MAVKKTSALAGTAPRRLVEIDFSHLDQLLDPSRVEHWTRELLKFGTKSEELRRSIAALEVVNQLRDAELEQQRELAHELRANCDAILVIASPGLQSSARCLTSFYRPLSLDRKPLIYFENPQGNTAWLNSLLQHLLQEGLRLGAVVMKSATAHPMVEAAQESLEEIIGLRHGSDEAQRRILVVEEANSPSNETHRRISYPDRLAQPFALYSAVGCLPLFLMGVDAFQFAEGARSMCRHLEKNFSAEEPALQFTAARLHLLAEKNLRELFFVSDPGLKPLGDWWETIMDASSVALGNPPPGSIARDYFDPRNVASDPPGEFGASLNWEDDDCPGKLLSVSQCIPGFPHIPLSVRKRDAFSLGVACAFLSCCASMTHRLINLPFAR